MNKLEEVKAEIETAGGVCACFSADLTDEENCKAMVDACVQEFGRLDILINSAGSRGVHGDLDEEFSTENFRHTMGADFDSTFLSKKEGGFNKVNPDPIGVRVVEGWAISTSPNRENY